MMTPDKTKTSYIINIQLMKIIGFYQLLDPNATAIYGCKICKLGGYISVLFLILDILMCNISIYHSRYDFAVVVRYIMIMFAQIFTMIKILFVITKSDVIWKLISFTSIDFLSYSGHQKCILMNARTKSIRISNIFTMFWIVFVALLVVPPIIINDNNYLNIKSKDSTLNQYRYNVLNLLFSVSTQFYNDNFNVFYLFETMSLTLHGYSMVIFDCMLISFCITISFQLKMIASSYKTLGYNDTNTDQIKSKLAFLRILLFNFFLWVPIGITKYKNHIL